MDHLVLLVFEGPFEGEWVNTTFGSTGPVTGSVDVDVEAGTVTIEADLGGFVFGAFDPESETITIDLAAIGDGPVVITSATFGDLEAAVEDGQMVMSSTNVPDPGIASIVVTGTAMPGAIDLAYVIEFTGGGGAEGIVTVISS